MRLRDYQHLEPLQLQQQQQQVPIESQLTPEELDDLRDFMRQDDSAILEEIRKFVAAYNIKQHNVADMAKISQAYVSRFFRGELHEMTDRSKMSIYAWYIMCKKNPARLRKFKMRFFSWLQHMLKVTLFRRSMR